MQTIIRVSGYSNLYISRIELEIILSFGKSYRGIEPLRRTYEHLRAAHRRDQSMPGLDAALADAQTPVAHTPIELLLICDSPVSMRSTFVLSS
jgi:hypothetical protein